MNTFEAGVTRTMRWFGAYAIAAGLGFLCFPTPLVELARLPPADPFWPRCVGVLALALGLYYQTAAHETDLIFARASVRWRGLFVAILAALIAMGEAPPTAGLFAGADLAGAIWTALALRRDPTQKAA